MFIMGTSMICMATSVFRHHPNSCALLYSFTHIIRACLEMPGCCRQLAWSCSQYTPTRHLVLSITTYDWLAGEPYLFTRACVVVSRHCLNVGTSDRPLRQFRGTFKNDKGTSFRHDETLCAVRALRSSAATTCICFVVHPPFAYNFRIACSFLRL
jgi:hypothetical protein